MTRSIALLGLATVLSFTATSEAVVYNYSDTTFVNADWIGALHADTSSPAGSFGATQVNGNGSPILPGPATPDYRNIRHTFGGPGAGAIVVSHQGVNFNWAPAPLETATTVDYSYDLRFIDGTAGGAMGFKPAIFQGGNVYATPIYDDIFITSGPPNVVSGPWTRFTGSGIPLASFNQINPVTGALVPATPPNPLAAMSFGFVSANSANQSSVIKIGGLDDYRFTLNTVVVPEPTTLACFAGVTLLLRRRRTV